MKAAAMSSRSSPHATSSCSAPMPSMPAALLLRNQSRALASCGPTESCKFAEDLPRRCHVPAAMIGAAMLIAGL